MGFIISEQLFLSSDVNSGNTKVYDLVQILDTDLISLRPIGKKGKSDLRQYTHPIGISHASTGEIYMTSFDYHEVLVFAPDGKFLNRCRRDKSYPIWKPRRAISDSRRPMKSGPTIGPTRPTIGPDAG